MAQNYEIDIKRFNGQDYDTLLPTPASHASTHQANGSDPITVTNEMLGSNSVGTSKMLNSSVTRVKLANDALYSPVVTLNVNQKDYAISAADIGKTIYTHSGTGNSYTVTLDATADASIPVGAEIAICYFFGDNLTVTMNGVKVYHSEIANGESNLSFRIPERYSMIALKKILVASNTGYWLVTGNVEVV